MQRSSQPTQLKSKFKALTALNCPGALLAPQESQQLLPRCVAQAGQVERAMTEEVGRPPKKDAPPHQGPSSAPGTVSKSPQTEACDSPWGTNPCPRFLQMLQEGRLTT